MDKSNLKMTVFCCSTSIDEFALRATEDELPGCELKVIALPCSGKLNILYPLKAFESGADCVMVVTCKKDECQYVQGSLRAENRMQAVDDLMDEIGLGRGRTRLLSLDDSGTKGVIEHIKAVFEEISALPASGGC